MKLLALPSSTPLRRGLFAAALLAAAALAQAQVAPPDARIEQARVVSATPLVEQGQVTGYTVEYEFNGQRFAALMAYPPGPTVPVQVSSMGVSTFPVAGPPPWAHVRPEPGVVMSPQGVPIGAPMGAPPPGVHGVPVYPGPQPGWVMPRPNVSLGLGYSGGGRTHWGVGLHQPFGWGW